MKLRVRSIYILIKEQQSHNMAEQNNSKIIFPFRSFNLVRINTIKLRNQRKSIRV